VKSAILNFKAYFSGTHRVIAPVETLAAIGPKVDLFGITRVANITGLDYLGIPVFAAVRPNSRGLSVHQGKGLTSEAAKASAIMEALEWHSGELPFPNAIWSSLNSLTEKACIFSSNLMRPELRRDQTIPWVEGQDLLKGIRTLVPEELVTTDYTVPARHGFGWFQASSNGLAAGNSRPEAQLHAICELIERDAFALWRLLPTDARTRTRIDPLVVGDAFSDGLMSRYDSSGMIVEAWDITSDIDVPAFFCVIDDRSARPPFLGRFGGMGCHPNAGVALCRALAEAAQSRCTSIAGARDDIPLASYAALGGRHNLTSLAAPSVTRPPVGLRAVRAVSFDTPSVEGDLTAVLSRLASRGVDSVAEVDLSHPEIGIPCLRVVIPGLEGMSDKSGYQPGERARRARRQWT
jgi:YcaO-like protein with predicted kinase domain